MSTMNVELVYFTGCPHVEAARDNIRQALAEMGQTAVWLEWDLEDGDTPEPYRSYASPTVLVGGRDVTNAPGTDGALSCSAGCAPPTSEIVRALGSAHHDL
jgi:hypothetical protein